jgi:hypothetical protein
MLTMHKHAALLIAGVAMSLALSGCAGTTAATTPSKTPHASASAAAAADEDCVICDPDGAVPQAEDDTAESTPPAAFAFGATATFEDGVTVTISTPTPYAPIGTDVAGVDFPQSVTSTVTIDNASSEAISQPAFVAQATSGGQAASAVFDEGNVNDVPGTTILPGQKLTYPIAFSVADPANLTVTYGLDWDNHANVTFSTDS